MHRQMRLFLLDLQEAQILEDHHEALLCNIRLKQGKTQLLSKSLQKGTIELRGDGPSIKGAKG